jgi:hypothetical protein
MTRLKVSAAAVFVFLAVVAAGCAGAAASDREPDLGVAAIQFADVPVPAGFHLVGPGHLSHSFEAAGFRYGDFEFTGPMSVSAASTYLKDRMREHGWELRGQEAVDRGEELRFARTPYETTCRLWRDDTSTRLKVAVRTKGS